MISRPTLPDLWPPHRAPPPPATTQTAVLLQLSTAGFDALSVETRAHHWGQQESPPRLVGTTTSGTAGPRCSLRLFTVVVSILLSILILNTFSPDFSTDKGRPKSGSRNEVGLPCLTYMNVALRNSLDTGGRSCGGPVGRGWNCVKASWSLVINCSAGGSWAAKNCPRRVRVSPTPYSQMRGHYPPLVLP